MFEIVINDPRISQFLVDSGLQGSWVQAGIILVAFLVLAFIFTFLTRKIVPLIVGKTKTDVDDKIIAAVQKLLFYLIIVIGARFAAQPINLPGIQIIDSVAALLFLMIFARTTHILIGSWGKALAKKTKTDIDETLLPLFGKAVNVFFIIFAVIWVLSIWDIDVTPWLAGLGVGGVVLGFALQDSLKNIFGGIALVLDRTLAVGDRVKLETGELGEVVDIGLRSTRLRTFDNHMLTIPNGNLATAKIQNYGQPNPQLRVKIFFGVEYGTNVQKAKKIVFDELKKIKNISKDPKPQVLFIEMGDSALNFQANIWVDDYHDAYAKKLEATEVIYNALNKAKISIPFPTRTVYTKKLK